MFTINLKIYINKMARILYKLEHHVFKTTRNVIMGIKNGAYYSMAPSLKLTVMVTLILDL